MALKENRGRGKDSLHHEKKDVGISFGESYLLEFATFPRPEKEASGPMHLSPAGGGLPNSASASLLSRSYYYTRFFPDLLYSRVAKELEFLLS